MTFDFLITYTPVMLLLMVCGASMLLFIIKKLNNE